MESSASQLAADRSAGFKFTGKERDSESGLDHTWFRQYSSSLGRWMHPDPAGLAAVDPSNPQSWNRYSYALNNSLSLVDRLGLWCNYMSDDGNIVESQDFSSDPGECSANGGDWVDPSGNNSFDACAPGAICIDVHDNQPPDLGGFNFGLGGGDPFGGDTSWSPFVAPDGPTYIGPTTSWFDGKQAGCISPGIKGFLGGIVMKKEIDAVGSFLTGASPGSSIPQAITPGAVSIPAHIGLDAIAGSPNKRPVIATIRAALREEGWKVSGNALARGAKFLGHIALGVHVGFAGYDGFEGYKACMEN